MAVSICYALHMCLQFWELLFVVSYNIQRKLMFLVIILSQLPTSRKPFQQKFGPIFQSITALLFQLVCFVISWRLSKPLISRDNFSNLIWNCMENQSRLQKNFESIVQAQQDFGSVLHTWFWSECTERIVDTTERFPWDFGNGQTYPAWLEMTPINASTFMSIQK